MPGRNMGQHCPSNFDRLVRVPPDPTIQKLVGAAGMEQMKVPIEHDWRQLFDIVRYDTGTKSLHMLGPAGHYCTRCLSEITLPDDTGDRQVKYTGKVEE